MHVKSFIALKHHVSVMWNFGEEGVSEEDLLKALELVNDRLVRCLNSGSVGYSLRENYVFFEVWSVFHPVDHSSPRKIYFRGNTRGKYIYKVEPRGVPTTADIDTAQEELQIENLLTCSRITQITIFTTKIEAKQNYQVECLDNYGVTTRPWSVSVFNAVNREHTRTDESEIY
ncbi:hypothetical protein TNCV_710821 [Trichonephila clavipes]|nr:hypothetical protein TNCV_710821 [Trichonephila clavipes]